MAGSMAYVASHGYGMGKILRRKGHSDRREAGKCESISEHGHTLRYTRMVENLANARFTHLAISESCSLPSLFESKTWS